MGHRFLAVRHLGCLVLFYAYNNCLMVQTSMLCLKNSFSGQYTMLLVIKSYSLKLQLSFLFFPSFTNRNREYFEKFNGCFFSNAHIHALWKL